MCGATQPAAQSSPARFQRIRPPARQRTMMDPSTSKTRILVVDDHPMVREWLAQMIRREPDLSVCGEADDAAHALESIAMLKPDMAIVDLTLKDSHGTEL